MAQYSSVTESYLKARWSKHSKCWIIYVHTWYLFLGWNKVFQLIQGWETKHSKQMQAQQKNTECDHWIILAKNHLIHSWWETRTKVNLFQDGENGGLVEKIGWSREMVEKKIGLSIKKSFWINELVHNRDKTTWVIY